MVQFEKDKLIVTIYTDNPGKELAYLTRGLIECLSTMTEVDLQGPLPIRPLADLLNAMQLEYEEVEKVANEAIENKAA